jgi:hypothetical protein
MSYVGDVSLGGNGSQGNASGGGISLPPPLLLQQREWTKLSTIIVGVNYMNLFTIMNYYINI